MKCVLRVLPYLPKYWPLAVMSVIGTVLTALTSLLAPWPLKIVVDNVLGQEPLPAILAAPLGSAAGDVPRLLVLVVAAGLVIALVQNGLHVLVEYANTKIEQRMVLDVRSDMFEHVQRLSLTFHDRRRSGLVIYAINFEASAVGRLILSIQPLAQSAITLVGMFWISIHIDAMVALLSMTVVPFLYYSVSYYVSYIQPRLLDVKSMEAESLSIIHEGISMMRVVLAFGREDHQIERFRTQGKRAVDGRVSVTLRQTLFNLAVNMITAVGTALVLGVGAYHALQNQLTVGQLLVLISYIAAVYKPLESISYTIGAMQDSITGLQMGFKIMDTEPEIKDRPDAIELTRAQGRVQFERVSFSYPGRADTLKDVSFEVQPGQIVAIVGPTGAGKSTLASLIPRFYDPQNGRILLDGRDIRDYQYRSLRHQVSIVLQDPLLFSGSIVENIRYGRLDATQEEVEEAAKAANAHEFIVALPDQYDTQLGERGAQLSGGERQRIAIARAFLKDAPILILDEPTSSVDSKTEAVILDALDRLMLGRTTFMIAHRLSTVRHADVILTLRHGQLVEQGTHDDLLSRGGLYRQLHDIQTGQRARPWRRAGVGTPPVASSASKGAANGAAHGAVAGHVPDGE